MATSSVVSGEAVLIVTHYEDDHSWAFLDGQTVDLTKAVVVAMSAILDTHPSLLEIADLPPGWIAMRTAAGEPWVRQRIF